MSTKGSVTVHADFLGKLAAASPINALSELIWNGLDAEAKHVRIDVKFNPLGGIEAILVEDDGHGIDYEQADALFSSLGGSWKRQTAYSKKENRLLHGKEGRGRFRAFALGQFCEWSTKFLKSDGIYQYGIIIKQDSLRDFEISDAKKINKGKLGTLVKIENVHKEFSSLESDIALKKLEEIFALYLYKYPAVSLIYRGSILDKNRLDIDLTTVQFPDILFEGEKFKVALDIVEWKKETDVKRGLYTCDINGFAFHEEAANIYAPGFSFTAYLKSDLFRKLFEDNIASLQGFNPEVTKLLEDARAELKKHFKHRLTEKGASIIEEWKREKVYPYTGEPKTPVEKAERQIFDVLALNINEYLPEFSAANAHNKKFSLVLLKQAISENPATLIRIFTEVLSLPKKKQDELAKLLERTSLTAIINASREIADRLEFLKGLETVLYDYEKHLLERSQLHRLIAYNAWIFGEEFRLTADDESLSSVLKTHREKLEEKGKKTAIDNEPVKVPRKKSGIVDIVISRYIDRGVTDRREHLVIELKRPSKDIDTDVISQIDNYALAAINDQRFFGVNTKWTFIALSNEMDEFAKTKAQSPDRPEGCIAMYEKGKHTASVWIKTWSTIIEECRSRLEFYRKELEYVATKDSSLDFLHKTYEEYIPSEVVKDLKNKKSA